MVSLVRAASLLWFSLGVISTLTLVELWSITWLESEARPKQWRLSVIAMEAARAALARPRVVVSLATSPLGDRFRGVADVLRSMANQSWSVDKVVLNIESRTERSSSESKALLHEAESWKQQYKWLEIRQAEEIGPMTKLLGALQVEPDPDTIIIVLDDCVSYHQDTVLALASTMLASPTDIAPCFQCQEVYEDSLGRPQWNYLHSEGRCDGFVSFHASYAVRPRFFDSSIKDRSQQGCSLHDDVWVSGNMLKASGVRPYLLRPGFDSVVQELDASNHHTVETVAEKRKGGLLQECVARFPFVAEESRNSVLDSALLLP